jgi:hypothetical protein
MPTPFWNELGSALRSLSLDTDAARLNDARLRDRRQEQGREAILPGTESAHGERMRRCLVALHLAIARTATAQGRPPTELFTLASALIRSGSGMSHDTLARGLRDLADARLIQMVPGYRGSPTAFRIVCANVRDLALSQGLQLELFDQSENTPVAGGAGQPHSACGRAGTTIGIGPTVAPRGDQPRDTRGWDRFTNHGRDLGAVGGAGQPCNSQGRREVAAAGAGRAPHGADTPPHGADTPPHQLGAEGSTACPLVGVKLKTSSTSSENRGVEGGEEEFWKSVRSRLRRLGVRAARETCGTLQGHGWAPEQVDVLLRSIESRAIGGVSPWQGWEIYHELRELDPGESIDRPESEAWRREQAAVAQRQRLRTEQAQQAAAAAAATIDVASLEATHGHALDALPRESLLDLAATVSPYVLAQVRRLTAGDGAASRLTGVRTSLLMALAKREVPHE